MTTQLPGTRARASAPRVISEKEAARTALYNKLVFEFNGKYNNFSEEVTLKNGYVKLKTGEFVAYKGMTTEQFKTSLGL